MKVLQINTVCNQGSTGKIMFDINTELLQNGNSSIMCYGRGNSVDCKNAYRIAYNFPSKIRHLLGRLTGKHNSFAYLPTAKVISIIKKEKPDIIHIHNLHGHYLNYVPLFRFLKEYNHKVVWTLHDCWSYTGFCCYYDFNNCNKWQTKCENCQFIKSGLYRTYFLDTSKKEFEKKQKAFLGLNDLTIVTPSKWLAEEVKKSFLKDYKIKVINNGINLNNFKPTNNHIYDDIFNDNKIVLAVAGEWEKRKGYQDLFKIKQNLPNGYNLLVVGVNTNQQKELQENGILAIAKTNNQVELAELYSRASVFINPTYEDNFPTVNIEALACGCPIITYNTGGSVEVVEKNNGIVVDKGDASAMVKAIPYAEKLKENSDEFIKQTKAKYSAKNMCDNYIKLYTNLE